MSEFWVLFDIYTAENSIAQNCLNTQQTGYVLKKKSQITLKYLLMLTINVQAGRRSSALSARMKFGPFQA